MVSVSESVSESEVSDGGRDSASCAAASSVGCGGGGGGNGFVIIIRVSRVSLPPKMQRAVLVMANMAIPTQKQNRFDSIQRHDTTIYDTTRFSMLLQYGTCY